MAKERVLASATVDELPCNMWRVHVWGDPPHDQSRTYTIQAGTNTHAAQEGIRRFVEEMQTLDQTAKSN